MIALETDRLFLRRWGIPADVDAARSIFADPEVMRYIPAGVMSDEQIERMMGRFNAEIDERGFGLWAVIERTSGRLVGESGLHVYAPTGEVEIAWLYAKDVWGNGYATEAGAAILKYGFERADLGRIICLVDGRNRRSMAVADRLGFAYLGDDQYYERQLRVYEKKSSR